MAPVGRTCPAGHELVGLGTYCWECPGYVEPRKAQEAPGTAPSEVLDPRSEKEIQASVKRFLQGIGYSVWDTSQPFAAKITPGLPDLFVTGRGRCVWIECKSAKGKQSEAQATFQAAVEANGGRYILARSEVDVAILAEQ